MKIIDNDDKESMKAPDSESIGVKESCPKRITEFVLEENHCLIEAVYKGVPTIRHNAIVKDSTTLCLHRSFLIEGEEFPVNSRTVDGDFQYIKKKDSDIICAHGRRKVSQRMRGWSLWGPHHLQPKALVNSRYMCQEIDLKASLPEELVLVYDTDYELELKDGEKRVFQHYILTPTKDIRASDLVAVGKTIKLSPCNVLMKAAAGAGDEYWDFEDADRNCDDACIACAWALQQFYLDEESHMSGIVDAFYLIHWLYCNEITLEGVIHKSKWASSFILRCLQKYKAPDNNSFLLINTDSASKTLESWFSAD